MITSLLKWAFATDVELWTENGKLKYRAEQGLLTDEMKRRLIDSREALIVRIEQNQAAKFKQWTTFEFGEMYSKRTAENAELCIFRNDNDTYTVWRANWRTGQSTPFGEKTLADGVSFQEALDRANNYYDWATNNKSKSRKAG